MKPHLFSSIPLGVIILTGIMFFSTCQEPEKAEPYPDSDLLLEKLDVSCTEAWLQVSLTGTDSGAATAIPIVLTRDGEVVNSFAFTPPETLVVDDGLNPSQSYQYQAQRQSVHDNKIIASSNLLSVTTLDTTSHNFSWTIDTLGEYGSYLNDVAIINENNIWAVGMIRTDSADYNTAHWDGERWEMVRIAPPPFLFAPLTSIYAISATEVWVAGTAPMEFDGEKWNAKPTYPTSGWINAIWGSSPEDVWFVGSGGSIVHYDGSGFTKLETGHDVRLISVSGSDDGDYVFVAGYSFVLPTQSTALMIHNNQVTTLYYGDHLVPSDPNDFGSVAAVSVLGDTTYFVTNIGLWKYNYRDGRSALDRSFHNYEYSPLIVQNINDMFMVGGGGQYAHFNGLTWLISTELYEQHHFALYNGDFKGNVAALGGYVNFGVGGVILRGYR